MSKYFLRIEGVNLHNLVADTQDLSTIRGGSLLLLDATEGIEEALNRALPKINLKEITTGASIGVYEFETDEGTEKAVKHAVLEHLEHQGGLRHATIVVDVQRAGADSDFGADVQALIARNRWQQMQSLSIALDSGPADKVCEVDKVRPAVTQDWIHGEDRWVSQSVFDRRTYGRKEKQGFYGRETERSITDGFAQDLDELSSDPSKGNLHHKIAIIYLDGNDFGKIKGDAGNTREVWEAFDQTVKTCRRVMLEGLLDAMSGDDDWKTEGNYRLETLLWGGDEIIWVVPAWKGWATLSHFYRSSESWSFRDKPLRHAGGVIFCHHNAPIHRLTRLVQELAGEAKLDGGRDRNRFAYEVLESFDHVGNDFAAYRQSRSVQPLDLAATADARLLILDASEMNFLQQQVRDMQEKLPRRKLHDVAEELLAPFDRKANESEEEQQPELAQRRKQREEIIKDFKTRLAKAGVADSGIQELEQRLGPDACWLHLNSLWDYLV